MSEAASLDAAPRREFSTRHRICVLGALMGMNLFNYMDRSILGVLIELREAPPNAASAP